MKHPGTRYINNTIQKITSTIVYDKVYKPIAFLDHSKPNDLSVGDLLAELFMWQMYNVMEWSISAIQDS